MNRGCLKKRKEDKCQKRFWLALCLRWRGERQEFSIHESPERFEIQWDGRFDIRDGAFFVESANPRIGVRTILGYPSTDIKDVLA